VQKYLAMSTRSLLFLFLFFVASFNISLAGSLKPGFNPQEYADLLALNFFRVEKPASELPIEMPKDYTKAFQSNEMGLSFQWDCWVRNDSVGVISLRGTVAKTDSWLANFFSAMVPAIGSLELSPTRKFDYQLAADSQATVHVGWLLGVAYLSPSVDSMINVKHKEGVREWIVMGHSQGGALAFLMRSYLQYDKNIPKDIQFKTYCSAAPKPGNLFYAYDFDGFSGENWSYRVVNTADWVPEGGISAQRTTDFNKVNPFVNLKPMLKSQKLAVRLYGNHVYSKMSKAANKNEKTLRKFLGKKMSIQVKKFLPELKIPEFSHSMNYMTAATPIILQPNEVYYQEYKNTSDNIFVHHMFNQYIAVLKLKYPAVKMTIKEKNK
jgi:hypothetical protein